MVKSINTDIIKKPKLIIGLVSLVVLGLAVLATVVSLKQRQEIRKKAAVPGGVATFTLVPQTSSVTVGQSLPVTIKFQSPSTPDNLGIAGISAVLSYTFTGENPLSLNPESIQEKLPAGTWNYIYKQVSTTGNTTTVRIAANLASGGATGYTDIVNPTDFVTLNFSTVTGGTVNLTFSSVDSYIGAKKDASDILSNNLPTGNYTITASQPNTCDATCNPNDGTEFAKCGYRNPDSSCAQHGNASCCHRECVSNGVCGPVFDGTLGTSEHNECDLDAPSQAECIFTCANSTLCPGLTCPAKVNSEWGQDGVCRESTSNPDCCPVVTNTPTPTLTLTPTPTVTITPTPTGGLTGTPTPTVTQTPGEVKIKVKVVFPGVSKTCPSAPPAVKAKCEIQNIRVRVVKNNQTLADLSNFAVSHTDQEIEVDGIKSAIYESAFVTLPNTVTAGSNYAVFIKGPKHLQTKYCIAANQTRPCSIGNSISFINNENTLDFTKYPLLAGDLPHPTYSQDGVVNSLDATYMISTCFPDPKETECLNRADLNLDGNINVQDIELINHTIFTRWEDDENG